MRKTKPEIPQANPVAQTIDPKSSKPGALSETELAQVAGGATKHPAKVTVPDLKLG